MPGVLDEIKHNGKYLLLAKQLLQGRLDSAPLRMTSLLTLSDAATVFIVYNQKTMQQSIWPQATKNGTFFTAMMLMCSLHLDGLTASSASATTTALKVEAMRLVRQSIQEGSRAAIINSIAGIACLATCALVCPISLQYTCSASDCSKNDTTIAAFDV